MVQCLSGEMADACRLVIAIDGPAAAGKSTVLNELARRLNALPFDTGLVYRALAWVAQKQGISLDDAVALTSLAQNLDLKLFVASPPCQYHVRILVNGQDITEALRHPSLGEAASRVAAYPDVRAALLPIQRAIAASAHRVVVAGRDVGTVVLPDATIKIWLDASLQERARRRFRELLDRGEQVDLSQVMHDLIERDRRDASRTSAPMQRAADAVIIPTDGYTVEGVVARILELVQEQCHRGDAASTV